MKKHVLCLASVCLATLAAHAASSDEILDKVDDFLTVNLLHENVRAGG